MYLFIYLLIYLFSYYLLSSQCRTRQVRKCARKPVRAFMDVAFSRARKHAR